jgi:DNA polymerase phi
MSKKRKHDGSSEVRHDTKKKNRHYTEEDQKLASIYERLADDSNEVRIQAAQDLLHELSPKEGNVNEKAIGIALRRLIRGLCSGRKAARFGFFIALTELLRALYGTDSSSDDENVPGLERTLDNIETLTKSDGAVNGQVGLNHSTSPSPVCRS